MIPRLVLATLMAAFLGACTERPPASPRAQVQTALGGASEGYARAEHPREFSFPRDHGPHPEYRNEWWYLTGNLYDPEGRRFGFQATFFRISLAPVPRPRASAWGSNQVWMAHAAVSDLQQEKHLAHERFARGALGLAGARGSPFRVWLEDWELATRDTESYWHLRLQTENFSLELDLGPLGEPILQGDHGLSRKNAAPGNASYYYSIPRLHATGRIRVGEEDRSVTGLAWLDREWSSSVLASDQVGWDWFSLQLSDGRDLMYYQLRDRQGRADRFSAGSLVSPGGAFTPLDRDRVRLEPLRWWTSPGGERYPVAWDLVLSETGEHLRVEAALEPQWMDLSVRYWEGAVDVTEAAGGSVVGSGYLELTGY